MSISTDDGEVADIAFLAAVQVVRDQYVLDTGGRNNEGRVTKAMRFHDAMAPASVVALEHRIKGWIESAVRDHPSLSIKASAGQKGRRYTLIPYVMVMRKDVTTTPTRGVYLAFLFDENCKSLWLSLNQGIAQFENRFEGLEVLEAVELVAGETADGLPAPQGFAPGRIELSARMRYGKAYERGAILSRKFDLASIDSNFPVDLRNAVEKILDVYAAIPSGVAGDLAGIAEARGRMNEAIFQAEVVERAAKLQLSGPLYDIPVPPPPKRSTWVTVYDRDPSVAATAIVSVEHTCEADCGNQLFIAASTHRHYVEAHHVIPLHHQHRYSHASLDVPANVVALCPMCHARIHRGTPAEKQPLLATLFSKRKKRLKAAGLHCSLDGLVRAYAGRKQSTASVANDMEVELVTSS